MEILVECVKQLECQLLPNFWFQLVVELLLPDVTVIENKRLLDKILYCVIEVPGEDARARLIEATEPYVKIFQSFINNILQLLFRFHNTINGAHQK